MLRRIKWLWEDWAEQRARTMPTREQVAAEQERVVRQMTMSSHYLKVGDCFLPRGFEMGVVRKMRVNGPGSETHWSIPNRWLEGTWSAQRVDRESN